MCVCVWPGLSLVSPHRPLDHEIRNGTRTSTWSRRPPPPFWPPSSWSLAYSLCPFVFVCGFLNFPAVGLCPPCALPHLSTHPCWLHSGVSLWASGQGWRAAGPPKRPCWPSLSLAERCASDSLFAVSAQTCAHAVTLSATSSGNLQPWTGLPELKGGGQAGRCDVCGCRPVQCV